MPRSKKTYAERACRWCGKRFVPVNTRARFCSEKCQRKRVRADTPEAWSPGPPPPPPDVPQPVLVTSDKEHTDDEREFIMAVDRYKRTKGRPYPALSELLAILRSLGYTKAVPRE